MSRRGPPPNKRLKLTGRPRVKLKRDPLGAINLRSCDMLNVLLLLGSLGVAQPRMSDTCAAGAFRVANALLTADTVGVGTSAASRDSSQIDTLTTGRFEGAPDVFYVVLSYSLSCLFAAPDSVIVRITSRGAGSIEPNGNQETFVHDTVTTVGYMELVTRSHHWRLKGPFAAVSVSPAAALRHFKDSLDPDGRQALALLVGRRR